MNMTYRKEPVHAGDPLLIKRGTHAAWTWEWTDKIHAMDLPPGPGGVVMRRPEEGPGDDHVARLGFLQRDLDETIRCAAWRREHEAMTLVPWHGDEWDERYIDAEGEYEGE